MYELAVSSVTINAIPNRKNLRRVPLQPNTKTGKSFQFNLNVASTYSKSDNRAMEIS